VTPFTGQAGSDSKPGNFTFAAWIKPTDTTTLCRESNRGIVGLSDRRNDALAAPHGDGFGGSGHAGCGLAVGTNGVCVFEHGANYFAPPLVHAATISDWTHVAVVYRDGQPSLYLNGSLARTGLKSDFTVHSGARAGGLAQFRGQLGGFQQIDHALSNSQVADLTRTMPRPDQSTVGSAIQLTKLGRQTTALVTVAGDYELQMANGKTRTVTVSQSPPPQTLTGPWDVQFPAGCGAPERVIFDQLLDWTQHPESGIKYFSGHATYRKTFTLPPVQRAEQKQKIFLNLGQVHDLAVVRVNGQKLGTLWQAPYQVDITSAARPGENTLEVEVVNVWNNRLVGDAALPAEQRRTFLLAPTVNKDTPLLPAGLLGPVSVRYVVEKAVE
ncbi:MAG TPA: LamG-like jellyroll fold domain-containing protein, partial [Clostridia bacterium]|nr:LamG-like jellyroll fold domain-containing protein [Clostridia bacterium]